MKGIASIFVVSVFFSFSSFAQETLTLTTYYPAPFGIYQRLATSTLGVGDNNQTVSGIDASDAPDPATNPGDVWVAGNVGIETRNPERPLHVFGGPHPVNPPGDFIDVPVFIESGDTGSYVGFFDDTTDRSGYPRIGAVGDNIHILLGRGDFAATVKMTLKKNGQLGLGTADPISGTRGAVPWTVDYGDVKLDVNGVVYSDGAKGTGKTFHVPKTELKTYHNGVPVYVNKNFENFKELTATIAACNRYCSDGCKASTRNCAGNLPGKGYHAGTAVEWNAFAATVKCFCN